MNPKTVLKYASDQGAKFVSVRFTDLPGSWQHLTFPIGELGEDTVRRRIRLRRLFNSRLGGNSRIRHASRSGRVADSGWIRSLNSQHSV